MFGFGSSAAPTTEIHTPEIPATNSSSIVANAEFGHGVGRETTIDYIPTEEEKATILKSAIEGVPESDSIPATMIATVKSALGLGGNNEKSEDGSIHVNTADGANVVKTINPILPAEAIVTTSDSNEVSVPTITVGPVIGLLTDTTCRVLIEANTTMIVKLQCKLVERDVRKTRHNIQLVHNENAENKILNVDVIQTGKIENKNPNSNKPGKDGSIDNSIPLPTTLPETAGNDKQAAMIMTGASSGSPVAGSAPGQLSAPKAHKSASSPSSSGTTVGDASGQTGSVSSETRSSPATQPSPTESSSQNDDGNDGTLFTRDIDCTAHRISTVTFTNLIPDCKYELTFTNIKLKVSQSTFTTLLTNWPVHSQTPLKFGVVSCNLISVTKDLALPDSDLWLDLQRRVAAGEIDYVLHIGDQIYADEKRVMDDNVIDEKYQMVFKTSVKMLNNTPVEQWPVCSQYIQELYRQLYRETWSHPPTAYVLANAPSLMIYDDHDFRDDWGNEECDSDPNSPEYYVGRCAHQIMCEYQRQLWDNVDFSNINAIKKDFHFHVFGEHGLIFLDVRGPRSLHKIEGEEYPYLGSLQWKELKDALSSEGIMKDVKSLFIICPAPIVFLPTTMNDLLGNTVIDDALGHWSSKPFKAEQLMMLDLCQHWKGAVFERELTFIGGDVHVGGNSEITRDGTVIFQQFITSAISNYILSKFEFFMGQTAQDLVTTLDNGWGFKHRGFTRSRNYGLIQTHADDLGPVIKRKHVTPEGETRECDNRIGIAHLT